MLSSIFVVPLSTHQVSVYINKYLRSMLFFPRLNRPGYSSRSPQWPPWDLIQYSVCPVHETLRLGTAYRLIAPEQVASVEILSASLLVS